MEFNFTHLDGGDWKDNENEIVECEELIKNKDYQKAKDILDDILNQNETNVAALFLKGVLLYKQREFENSLKYFEKITETVPNHPLIWFNIGCVYDRLKDYEKSLEAYNKSLEIDSGEKNVSSYVNKALALMTLSKFDEAIETFIKISELVENNEVYYNLALCYYHIKEYEKAVEASNKSIELDDEFPDAFFNRACFYSLLENKKEALSDLKKSISLDNTFAEEALKDDSFENLWTDKDFLKVVGK